MGKKISGNITERRPAWARSAWPRLLPKLMIGWGLVFFWLALAVPPLQAQSQREAFSKAMAGFDALLEDKVRGMQREPWEKLEGEFARIRAMQGQFNAEAFFYQARSREELADRSKRRADFQEAVRLYGSMARTYPAHALADNALYNQAMILSGPLKEKAAAVKALDVLVLQYPEGDMFREAVQLRERLEGGSVPAAASSPGVNRPDSQADERPNYDIITAPPAESRAAQANRAGGATADTRAAASQPPAPATSVSGSGTAANPAAAQKQRELYEKSAAGWKQLLAGTHPRSGHRDVWLALERDFKQAGAAAPAGPYADKSAFQAARCREELARRSKSAADWKEAVALFAVVARDYPQSSLADDSLYAGAVILFENLRDNAGARAACQVIIDRYPKGDMVQKARALLKRLPAASRSAAPVAAQVVAPSTAGPAAPAASAAAPAPVRSPAVSAAGASASVQPAAGKSGNKNAAPPSSGAILKRLAWKGDAGAFILTIELAGKAKYRRNTLPAADGTHTARIQIDLLQSKLDGQVEKLLRFEGLPVSAIRSCQADKNTVRVVLEAGEARSYKVSVLQNPYRLQVEVNAKRVLSGGHDLKLAVQSGQSGQPGARSGSAAAGSRPAGSIVEQLGLAIKTVAVDAGHGGNDPGAVGNGITERVYTLELAKLLGKRLEKKGFKVIYTRDSNKYVALKERTTLANERKADIFISIHVNSSTNKKLSGVETYYLDVARSNAASVVAARENAVDVNATSDLQFILSDLTRNSKRDESKAVAALVQDSTLKQLQKGGFSVKNNGVRSAPFYVLMGARMPAFLIEVGYLSNSSDATRLKNKKYMEKLADGITDGIVAYRNKINSIKP